jgi:hypothetical protein
MSNNTSANPAKIQAVNNTQQGHKQKKPTQSFHNVSRKELIKALSIAFCYMPEPNEINTAAFGTEKTTVNNEVRTVRQTLSKMNLKPENIYQKYSSINVAAA